MRYNNLGRSGLVVSEFCLGAMTFSGDTGWRAIGRVVQETANQVVRAAFDSGVNFIDTANIYSESQSEAIVGQALGDLGIPRHQLVIATKVLGRMHAGPNGAGASYGHIMAQVDQSLRRLRTDYIDLYQLHGWDPTTSVEEQLDALDATVRAGKVRYIGVSNWAAWQVAKAQGIAARRNRAPITALQGLYTVANRDLERDVVPMLVSEGVGLMVWGPLAGGFLTGKYPRGGGGDGRRAHFDFPPIDKDRAHVILDVLRPMAEARQASIAQLALAWLLHQPAVSSVILGARHPDQLAENLKAVEIAFSAQERAAIDGVSRLPLEYPCWMQEVQGGYRTVSQSLSRDV